MRRPLLGRVKVALLILAAGCRMPAAAADRVTVDRENKRAEVVVTVPDGRIVVTLDPLTSLIIHCVNLYDLNRQSGARYYAVRQNEEARKAVDQEIYQAIAGKDRYFSGGPLRLYTPTMTTAVEGGHHLRYPRPDSFSALAPPPFDQALRQAWEGFYRQYWDDRFEALLAEFRLTSEAMDWARSLELMQKYTGRSWSGTMYVVVAEGTGMSALTAGSRICVGSLGENRDAGFVHEGLHLLLKEEWAKSPPIREFMAQREFNDPFWKKNWPGKYEQAVVASLDILIRGMNLKYPESKVVRNYLSGVQVGDIADVVWPLVKQHVTAPQASFEDLMVRVVRAAEPRGEPAPG